MNQIRTPIFDALKAYVDNNTISFHVPGHKRGHGMDAEFRNFVGDNVLGMDVTVFKSVDSFHNPKSVIKESQELAALAYGAKESFYCVHGTSGAIQAMIMSVVGYGEKIIVPRNIHKSVVAGIILSGSIPVYIQPEIDHKIGVALNVTCQKVRKTLEEHTDAKAVLIINPTYYGVSSDIENIANIVHEYGLPLLVDEAHGPHLRFSNKLPISAMDAGADVCCQSSHKLIGAMTQGSVIHVQGDYVSPKRVKAILNMMHTTSPSYVILASLDVARKQMATDGRGLLKKTIYLAEKSRNELNNIPGIYCFGREVLDKDGAFDFDPTKLTINCRGLGISGYKLESELIDKHNIQVEMSDLYNVLAVVTIGDSDSSLESLVSAVEEISSRHSHVEYVDNMLTVPAIPPRVLLPRDAFYSKSRSVELEASIGLISAEMLMAYPPGIPILCQGEVITEEIVQYVKMLKFSGLDVQGTMDPNVESIQVIDPIMSLEFVPTA